MRERSISTLFGQLGMLFEFWNDISAWKGGIMFFRISVSVSARPFGLCFVFVSVLLSSAFYFHVTILFFFLLWSHAFFRCIIWGTHCFLFFFSYFFFFFLLDHSSMWSLFIFFFLLHVLYVKIESNRTCFFFSIKF